MQNGVGGLGGPGQPVEGGSSRPPAAAACMQHALAADTAAGWARASCLFACGHDARRPLEALGTTPDAASSPSACRERRCTSPATTYVPPAERGFGGLGFRV
jgi:hypothetical protein